MNPNFLRLQPLVHDRMPIGEILRAYPQTAEVFVRLGIRFPREEGSLTLRAASAEAHVGIDRLLHALNCAIGRPDWDAVRHEFRRVDGETPVADVVVRLGAGEVLHEMGIRPCQAMQLRLKEAAARFGVDLSRLLERLGAGATP